MKTRIITAAVGVAVFIAVVSAAVIFDPIILCIVLTAAGAIGVYEAISHTGYVKSKFLTACCMVYALITPFFYSGYINVAHEACLVLLGFLLFTFGMFNHSKVSPTEITCAFSLTVIITFCFWALFAVFDSEDGHGLFYFIIVFVAAWTCDSGAYFAGYFFGRHKMAPEISPKKTVEGAVGGIITAVLSMWIACIVFMAYTGNRANTVLLLAVTPLLAAAGMIGDLIASYIKRSCNIKDYGNIMPGHGGVLDRFDSVAAVVPLVYILVTHCPVVL